MKSFHFVSTCFCVKVTFLVLEWERDKLSFQKGECAKLSLLGLISCHALTISFSCIMLHVLCMYCDACFALHERAHTHLRNLWWNYKYR